MTDMTSERSADTGAITQTFCGACAAYIKELQSGPIRSKLFWPAIAFFTDAVIFIGPPYKTRLLQGAGAIMAVGLGEMALAQANDAFGKSAERQVPAVNERLSNLLYTKYGTDKVTSHDVAKEFGEWADAWPNSRVIRATMRTKGIILKRIEIRLTPDSGLKRGADGPLQMAGEIREMLSKAFGSRFSEQ